MKAPNNSIKAILVLMIIISASLGAIGQLLFKFGVGGHINLMYLATGVVVYGISTAIYFVVLSRSHLSWTYCFGGISYVVAVFLALIFLHEKVTIIRWAGVTMIALGAAMIGLS